MALLNWMQRYAAEEVVEHAQEGRCSRREMMQRLVAICGTPAVATAFLASCASTSGGRTSATTIVTPSSASSAATTSAVLSVASDDPAVKGAEVTFPCPAGTLLGYLARPSIDGPRAGIIVNHEIFGLTDHIRDVVRRLAKAGYVALAVDLASRAGGTAKAGNVAGALTQGSVADRVADLDGGYAFLQTRADFNGKLGVTGFCFGGGMTLSFAAAQPKVLAAVAYYGPTPDPASVMSTTNAAILAQYGANDARVNAGIDALEKAMAGKVLEKRVYDGAGHAFNNDTGGAYVEARAVEAWTATLDWFGRYLA